MIYRILIIFVCFLPVSTQAKTLLVLGDSLSAAYGIPVDQGWVSLLEQRIIRQQLGYKVVNASISGETTIGAKTRLQKLMDDVQPELVIVELGGNDGLRGFSLQEIEQNLIGIIEIIQQAGSRTLLVPMQLPPNYGAAYNKRFISIYDNISNKMNVNLSKFILSNIAQYPELMQSDGIHPVQAAQPKMLENVWPSLLALMSE